MGGSVEYGRRYVRTRSLELDQKEGRSTFDGLGMLVDSLLPSQLPDVMHSMYDRMRGESQADAPLWMMINRMPANTSVVLHAGRMIACYECGHGIEVSCEDMTTLGVCRFGGTMTEQDLCSDSMSAHAIVDSVNGEMLYFSGNMIKPLPQMKVV